MSIIRLIAISAALFAQTDSGIKGVVAGNARPELVQEGFMFTEGPVGTADGGLFFSDIMGADKTYRLDSTDPGPRPIVPDRKAFVYYVPSGASQARMVDDSITRPNGLALRNDGKGLIVDDTVGDTVFVFDVAADGSLKSKRPFAKLHEV